MQAASQKPRGWRRKSSGGLSYAAAARATGETLRNRPKALLEGNTDRLTCILIDPRTQLDRKPSHVIRGVRRGQGFLDTDLPSGPIRWTRAAARSKEQVGQRGCALFTHLTPALSWELAQSHRKHVRPVNRPRACQQYHSDCRSGRPAVSQSPPLSRTRLPLPCWTHISHSGFIMGNSACWCPC